MNFEKLFLAQFLFLLRVLFFYKIDADDLGNLFVDPNVDAVNFFDDARITDHGLFSHSQSRFIRTLHLRNNIACTIEVFFYFKKDSVLRNLTQAKNIYAL